VFNRKISHLYSPTSRSARTLYAIMNQLDILYYFELQKRLKEIVLFISCHQDNYNTYSIKIENLFVDICSFFDSLTQTWITEKKQNGFSFTNEANVVKLNHKLAGRDNFNFGDYKILLEPDFNLSAKEVNLNIYQDNYFGNPMNFSPSSIIGHKLKPFDNWTVGSLSWWSAFTKLKHNRLSHIKEATLGRTLNSLAAVYIILSLKNEQSFKEGNVSEDIYEVYFPLYWVNSGRKMSGIITWKK
jgi:hypothetical protein